jgi:hypothetical protein
VHYNSDWFYDTRVEEWMGDWDESNLHIQTHCAPKSPVTLWTTSCGPCRDSFWSFRQYLPSTVLVEVFNSISIRTVEFGANVQNDQKSKYIVSEQANKNRSISKRLIDEKQALRLRLISIFDLNNIIVDNLQFKADDVTLNRCVRFLIDYLCTIE